MKQELANYLNARTNKLKDEQRKERNSKVTLPEGHNWVQLKTTGSINQFACKCGAFFEHDMIDNTADFEDGDQEFKHDDANSQVNTRLDDTFTEIRARAEKMAKINYTNPTKTDVLILENAMLVGLSVGIDKLGTNLQ